MRLAQLVFLRIGILRFNSFFVVPWKCDGCVAGVGTGDVACGVKPIK